MLAEITNAVFGYKERPVVQVEQLHLRAGRCLGIFGPNGSGKTTLVRGMVGLLQPLQGTVTRAPGLRFGYLQQHRALDLHWPMTGLDAACMAISARKRVGWIGGELSSVRQAMVSMGVSDLSRRPFARLSGGQQQRLLLAGAMAADPQILLLDEPTDGLDVRSRRALLELLREQNANSGLCTVMISHEIEDLLFLGDEIAWLHMGDDPAAPSNVELLAPEQMAQKVTHANRAAS